MTTRRRCSCKKGACTSCICAFAARQCAECDCGAACVRRPASVAARREERGNFPRDQRDIICQRARFKCANPGCTTKDRDCGKNIDHGGFTMTGEVAHIHAASPNGPRFKADMTDEERNNAFTNGILLCCNCHTLVDRFPQQYPAELLFTWKRAVEGSNDAGQGGFLLSEPVVMHAQGVHAEPAPAAVSAPPQPRSASPDLLEMSQSDQGDHQLPLPSASALSLAPAPLAIETNTEESTAPRVRTRGWLTAAKLGDVSAARACPNLSTIDKPDCNGCTPLSLAVQNGHHAVMRVLIQRGAAVDAACKIGYTPLIWAAELGDVEACRVLLSAGANHAHASREGWTALAWAAAEGNVAIIKLLLEHGAAVDFYPDRKSEQFPPLYIAAQEARLEAVKLLVSSGANRHWRDKNGRTARDAAPEGPVRDYLDSL